jgi:molybdate transport system substrate-binding protein
MIRLLLGACLMLLLACNSDTPTLRLAVAANLVPPLEAIQQSYQAQTGVSIEISAASSGALNAQIRNGAPFDIYLSANKKYPRELKREGIGKGEPLIFTFGKLMLWSKKQLSPDSLTVPLTEIQNKRLALPDPDLAPYGLSAMRWLKAQQLWSSWQSQLIIGNNISHTNQIIRSGSVDFAFTAASARHWGTLGELGYWYEVPDVKAIPHSLLILNESPEIRAFVTFLQSKEAADILMDFGYLRALTLPIEMEPSLLKFDTVSP